MSLLEIEGIDCAYGRVQALYGVSLRVEAAEIVSLIGANGAGKSTVLRAISGLLSPLSGSIRYQGQAIQGGEAEQIVRMGIAHVPEGRRIFPGLSVIENLEVAATWRRLPRVERNREIERILELFPNLQRRRASLGWSLSGGEQQMLAIGRALLAHPKLLLLDEPSLGLAPNLVVQVFEQVQAVGAQGTAVLVVEQNAVLAMEVSSRTYVLENGRVVMSGPSSELAADSRVQSRYLGR